jgi:hypothetical protein
VPIIISLLYYTKAERVLLVRVVYIDFPEDLKDVESIQIRDTVFINFSFSENCLENQYTQLKP